MSVIVSGHNLTVVDVDDHVHKARQRQLDYLANGSTRLAELAGEFIDGLLDHRITLMHQGER